MAHWHEDPGRALLIIPVAPGEDADTVRNGAGWSCLADWYGIEEIDNLFDDYFTVTFGGVYDLDLLAADYREQTSAQWVEENTALLIEPRPAEIVFCANRTGSTFHYFVDDEARSPRRVEHFTSIPGEAPDRQAAISREIQHPPGCRCSRSVSSGRSSPASLSGAAEGELVGGLWSAAPEAQRCVSRHVLEVPVGAEHREVVAQAELCQENVDGPDLHSVPSAGRAQVRRGDVVVPVRHEERQRRKPFQDRLARLRSPEALQDLLQDQTGRADRLAPPQRTRELLDDRVVRPVPSHRQRPNAGVDEEAHPRDRSAL